MPTGPKGEKHPNHAEPVTPATPTPAPRRGSAWAYGKGLWGVLITFLTFWIAYQQLHTSSKTVRPSLLIDLVAATPDVVEQHGERSHAFRLHNVGTTVARDVTLSIWTRYSGKTIHEDRK